MRKYFLFLILSFTLGIWGGVILMNYLNQNIEITSVDTLRIFNMADYEQTIEIVTEINDNSILLNPRENIVIKCDIDYRVDIYWIPLGYNKTDGVRYLLLRIDKDENGNIRYYETEKYNIHIECQINK